MNILNNETADEADKKAEQSDLQDCIHIVEKVKEIHEIQHQHSGSKRFRLTNLVKIQKFEDGVWVTYDESMVEDEYNIHTHFYEGWDLNFKKRKLSIRQKTLEILKCHAEYKMQLATPVNHKSYAVTPRLSSSSAHGTFEEQSPMLGRTLIRSTVGNTGNRVTIQPTVGSNSNPEEEAP